MEVCKICGKPINERKYGLIIDDNKCEEVCGECSVKAFIIDYYGYQKESYMYKESVNWFSEIKSRDETTDEGKEIISKILENKVPVYKSEKAGNAEKTPNSSEQGLLKKTGAYLGKQNMAVFVGIISNLLVIVLPIAGAYIGKLFDIPGMVIGFFGGIIIGEAITLPIKFLAEMAENIAKGVNLLNSINDKLNK